MAALGTNVLVRWLTDDDAAQCARVEALLDSAQADDEPLFVPVTVLLEAESSRRDPRTSPTASTRAWPVWPPGIRC